MRMKGEIELVLTMQQEIDLVEDIEGQRKQQDMAFNPSTDCVLHGEHEFTRIDSLLLCSLFSMLNTMTLCSLFSPFNTVSSMDPLLTVCPVQHDLSIDPCSLLSLFNTNDLYSLLSLFNTIDACSLFSTIDLCSLLSLFNRLLPSGAPC